MKKQARNWTIRSGHAAAGGVLLAVGAIAASGVACYGVWTIFVAPGLGAKGAGSTLMIGNEDTTQMQADDDTGGMQHDASGIDAESGSTELAPSESIEEILGAVQVYVRNKQYAQATTVLEHACMQYPNDQELRLSMGDLYMMQERYADAYREIAAAIEIGPTNAKAEFTAGTLANMLDQLELAEAHFASAMRIDPTNPDTPLFLAAVQLKMNKLDEARKNLAIAGKMSPESARIYAMRSELAMRENKVTIALDQIRKARAIEPDVLAWLVAEAKVLKRAGRAEEAMNLLASLSQENRENLDVAYLMAQCYGMLGRSGDAASFLMDIYPKHEGDARLAFEIALWFDRADEPDEAMEWAQRSAGLGYSSATKWVESKRDE